MILILASFAGVLVAVFVHWFTWYMRLRHLSLAVAVGAVSAVGLTGFFLLFLTSDIANMMLILLAVLWAVALAVGYLQARSLPAAWWKGVLALFFEVALAFLVGAAVNLTLQQYIEWLNQQFPGLDVYAIIDSFLRGLAITLLLLAVIRPLLRFYRSRSGFSTTSSTL